MKKIIAFAALLCCTTLYAKAPKWLKNARRTQATVIAFAADGTPRESQGVFVDKDGALITDFDIFKGAARAVVIDYAGKEHPVRRILGASSMYNVIKLAVDMGKTKFEVFTTDSIAIPEGQPLHILPTAKADKSVPTTTDTIARCETFAEHFHYYTLNRTHSDRLTSCGVLSEDGKLVGLLQKPAKADKPWYVIDARFAAQLSIRPMDAKNDDLRAISIPKALPANARDAASYIFLYNVNDTAAYLQCIDDYLLTWPDSMRGYLMKAEAMTDYQHYAEADEAYAKALTLPSVDQSEVYYSWAKAIYNENLSPTFTGYETWTMERAIAHAESACAESNQPIYRKVKADCLYALKRYAEAREIYVALAATNLRSADLFLYAAACKQQEEGSTIEDVIALQDSALNCYKQPYPAETAPILLLRANSLAQAGKARQAVADLIVYEQVYRGILNAEFFYQREQLALKCRMYPTALNDIAHAVSLDPQDPVFRAEMAAVCYRLEKIDEAVEAAKIAIAIDENFADAHRILGVCYQKQGNTTLARTHLQKAVALGDAMSKELLNNLK